MKVNSLALTPISRRSTRGRALQQVRPGLVIKGILQRQIPLTDNHYVAEASASDIYAVYARAARREKLSRPKGRRVYRHVMSYDSFKTFFKFACLLRFVEPTQDEAFRITEIGRNAWQEWEDLRRAWQRLVKGKVALLPPQKSEIDALTHEGIIWICQEYALRHGLAPISHAEAGPLAGSGHPDLLLGNELGTRFYAVEVKPKKARSHEALRGIGQCAAYKCSIPNVSPCLVIPEGLSEQVCFICNKLSFNWMSVVTFNGSGEFSLVYGKDSFL